MLWKMLLTKLSYVLDPALDMLANMVSDSSYLKGQTLNLHNIQAFLGGFCDY